MPTLDSAVSDRQELYSIRRGSLHFPSVQTNQLSLSEPATPGTVFMELLQSTTSPLQEAERLVLVLEVFF